LISGLLALGLMGANVYAAHSAPTLTLELPNATQGPLWPPGELTDDAGNFVVVGLLLKEVEAGVVQPVPGAALVSADTVPPLNAQGREDFTKPLAAPYRILRELDLSPAGADRDIVLHSSSFGPAQGDFGGGPRIPAQGGSAYNLNGSDFLCPELFPATSQRWTYGRPSVPLQAQPVWGFQGDNYHYDVDTGKAEAVAELPLDKKPVGEVTLGRWLRARGMVDIRLTNYSAARGAYTAADFHFKFSKLLPHSLYTVWAIRLNNLVPMPVLGRPDPLAIPNVVVADRHGRAHFSTRLINPFPAPEEDPTGSRLIGFVVNYHDDYQNWGACPARLGPGVESHSVFNTLADGSRDITSFITRAPQANATTHGERDER